MDLPILLYHSVSDAVSKKFQRWSVSPILFAEHIAYMRDRGFTPVTITRIAQSMMDPAIPMPPNPVAVTFDDGIADFMTGALPALVAYGFCASMYIPTCYIGKTTRWLNGSGEGNRPVMNWADLEEAELMGVELGAHSHRHSELDTLSDQDAWLEITTSKDILEQGLGHRVDSFAYPHGYHSVRTERLVKKAGYTSACAVKHALSSLKDDRFGLARIIITQDVTVDRLGQLLEGRGLVPVSQHERLETTVWRIFRTSSARFRRLNFNQRAQ